MGSASYDYVTTCIPGEHSFENGGLPFTITVDQFRSSGGRVSYARYPFVTLYDSMGEKEYIIRILPTQSAEFAFSKHNDTTLVLGNTYIIDEINGWSFQVSFIYFLVEKLEY